MKATGDWKGLRVTVKLTVINRQATVCAALHRGLVAGLASLAGPVKCAPSGGAGPWGSSLTWIRVKRCCPSPATPPSTVLRPSLVLGARCA